MNEIKTTIIQKSVVVRLIFLGFFLGGRGLSEVNGPVSFTMRPLEPGQIDQAVSFTPGAGGQWSGSCQGTVEETWSGITYYTPANCTGDYQERARFVGPRSGFRFDKFFVFRDLLNSREMSVMSSGESCPDAQTYNYLLIRGRNPDDYVSPMNYGSSRTYVAGSFRYDQSDISGISRFSLETLSPVSNNTDAFSYQPTSSPCAFGDLISKSSDFDDTPLGKYPYWVFGDTLAISTEGGSNPLMSVAVPQEELPIENSFWLNKNKNVYSGLMTHFLGRGRQTQRNIYLSPDGSGRVFDISEVVGTAGLNDVSLRTRTGSLDCRNLNAPSTGFCSGTLSFVGSPQTGKAVCLFSFDNQGKDLVFCAAQSPRDRSQLVTFLAGTSAVSVLEVAAGPLHLSAGESSGVLGVTLRNLTSRPALRLDPDALEARAKLEPPFIALTNESLSGTFPPGGFVSSPICGTSLPAFSTCTIPLTYAPASERLDKQEFRLPYDKSRSNFVEATKTLLASRGLSSLSVTAPDFPVGGTSQVRVIAVFSSGGRQDVTGLVEYQSSNASLPISSGGVLSAPLQSGTTTVTASFGSFSGSATLSAYPAPPNPPSFYATAVSPSQIDLNWSSGGESTSSFQIAFQIGATAPQTCSEGTFMGSASIGLATKRTVTGLSDNTLYSFRLCAVNGAGIQSSGLTASAMTPLSPPTLSLLSPLNGPLSGGGILTLTGTGFVTGLSVTVGGAPCVSVNRVSSTQATCVLPAGAAGAKTVVVTHPDGQSAFLTNAYTYQAGPTLTAVSPLNGPLSGGGILTLTGTGFVTGLSVTVGGAPCVSVNRVSSTQATCVLPAGAAGAKTVVVTHPDGQFTAQTVRFFYNPCPILCGGSGNGCYDNPAAMNATCATIQDGNEASAAPTRINYSKANPACSRDCFQVWRESTSNRILNSTGLWAPPQATPGWQKRLNPSGMGENGDLNNASVVSQISGRVCPFRTPGAGVFINYTNMTQTGRCLYYDSGNPRQSLDRDYSPARGTEGVDWLRNWTSSQTGRGSGHSYYEGNIKTCNVKGMRLPTMYEANYATRPSDRFLPTNDRLNPIWPGSVNGVPMAGHFTWTASANQAGYDRYRVYGWNGDIGALYYLTYGYSFHVRCVLP